LYYCAQDLLEYLLSTTGGGSQDTEHRALRAAASNGYRDVIYHHDWNWHDTVLEIPGEKFEEEGQPFGVLLPRDCKNIDSLVAPDRTTQCVYTTLQEYLRLLSYDSTAGSTIWWTVAPDGKFPDRMRLLLGGKNAPIYKEDSYLISYRRKPEPLRYFGYERACRDSQEVPNGTVLRWGTATNYPEGPYGIRPFTAEVIAGDPDTLVGSPPDGARTAFSDRLDVPEYLFSATLSACEVWYARLMGQNVEGALTVHNRDMRLAMEQDGMAPMSGRRKSIYRYPEGVEMPYASTGTARGRGYYSQTLPNTGDVIGGSVVRKS